ncbi:hypothetical protein NN561_008833 [Cricetulus griseus]
MSTTYVEKENALSLGKSAQEACLNAYNMPICVEHVKSQMGVTEENSDRLEWIQAHVQCEGLSEQLVFSSVTNCLGPRKFLHRGKLYKAKSYKELYCFLFNNFLLLIQISKPLGSSSTGKVFSPKSNLQYKTYKMPIFLNKVLVKLPTDPSGDEPILHISHIDCVYTLRADSINARTAWVQKIKAAPELYIEPEKKKREKAYLVSSQRATGIGEIRVADIKKDQGSKGPVTKCLLPHEVPTGEIVVRIDLP